MTTSGPNFTGVALVDLDEDGTGAKTTWMATTTPIPEPTSGLLLLLGVAGLALRRRHA